MVPACPRRRYGLVRSLASGVAAAAGGADLVVGDLVGEQSVDLGRLGGGVAEPTTDGFDGDARVDQFGGAVYLYWILQRAW